MAHMNETNSKIDFSSMSDEQLVNFVDSKAFFCESFIMSLVEQAIRLGFNIESIKETLKYFLQHARFSIDLKNPDYKSLIDSDKFLEKLISVSSQLEMSSNNANNISNKVGGRGSNLMTVSDLVDFDDDYNDEDETYTSQYFNNEESFESKFNNNQFNGSLLKDFNYGIKQQISSNGNSQMDFQLPKKFFTPAQGGVSGLASTSSIKKPMSSQQIAQQQHQEYVNQSMLKINDKNNLRPIIVDANDVGLSSHPNSQIFMLSRVKKVADYFEKRNHQIYVILSSYRKENLLKSNENCKIKIFFDISQNFTLKLAKRGPDPVFEKI